MRLFKFPAMQSLHTISHPMFIRIFITTVLTMGAASAQITFPLQSANREYQAVTRHDTSGNLYVAGLFSGGLDFDPGPQVHSLDTFNGESIFLASYDPSGILRWVRMIEPATKTLPDFDADDDADATVYDDGWQNVDLVPGFTNWVIISEATTTAGRRELNTTTPLSGSRSWLITASNLSFYGTGRGLNPPILNGQISVLIRHNYEPTGSFVGFNLSSTLSSSFFGWNHELASFGFYATNTIGITPRPYLSPQHFVSPTMDGDLRGDLLEYIISIRSNGTWNVKIVNLSEPGSPIASTNIALTPNSTVRSIRFGTFIGGTNQFLHFDRIRIKYDPIDSAMAPVNMSIVDGTNVWIHGGLFGSLSFSDGTTGHVVSSVGGTNGFAIGYNPDGYIRNVFQLTSTSAPGNSIVSGVARSMITNLHFFGHFSGSLNLSNRVIQSVEPLLWSSYLSPVGNVIDFYRYFSHGTHQAYGSCLLNNGTPVMLGSFTNMGPFGLFSEGGNDVMIVDASFNAFRFGGPGEDRPCHDCIAADDSNALYFGGQFQQTISSEANPMLESNITATGDSDIFIASSDGTYVNWARAIGGAESNVIRSLVLDQNTNIVIAGTFRGTMEMDGLDGTFMLSSTSTGSGMDGFVAQFDRTGKFRWAHRVGSDTSNTGIVEISSLAIDSQNRLTMVGHFTKSVNFETSDSAAFFTNTGHRDVMIMQLNDDGSMAGPTITYLLDENGDQWLSVPTRAGVQVQIESSDLTGPWNYVAGIPQTTGNVHIATGNAGESNLIYRAVTDW